MSPQLKPLSGAGLDIRIQWDLSILLTCPSPLIDTTRKESEGLPQQAYSSHEWKLPSSRGSAAPMASLVLLAEDKGLEDQVRGSLPLPLAPLALGTLSLLQP